MITWQCKSFNELTNEELYKILQLRIEVFAVEQNVVYQDCDNKDFKSYHFTAWNDNKIIAYSRILPPGIAYPEAASIGRVVTSPVVRGQSLGKQLFEKIPGTTLPFIWTSSRDNQRPGLLNQILRKFFFCSSGRYLHRRQHSAYYHDKEY